VANGIAHGSQVVQPFGADSKRDVDIFGHSGSAIEKNRLPSDDHVGNINSFECLAILTSNSSNMVEDPG
jgi:hypothetical protein